MADRAAVLFAMFENAIAALEDASPCDDCGALPAENLRAVEAALKVVDRYASTVVKHAKVTEGIKARVFTEARGELVARLAAKLREHKGKKLTDELIKDIAAGMQR